MKKNILIGVTGGIAAYKTANIISKLKKEGCEVKVVMTEGATKFITPLTLETLSKNKVFVSMWEEKVNDEVEHIELAKWADTVLIVPTTYNFVGKIASGIADDLLTTVVAATKAKVYMALAMNTAMYNNPILWKNINYLKGCGYSFIEAESGNLACSDTGKGRLRDENKIIAIIKENNLKEMSKLDSRLVGKRVLITAGATREKLDPIRYLTNRSTGKMGYALAETFSKVGAKVCLVSGVTDLKKPEIGELVEVESAKEMYDEVASRSSEYDIIIGAAAVADYTPKDYSDNKLKKSGDNLIIELERTTDILQNLGRIKTDSQILIGFAAETEKLIQSAKGKLVKKNLDMIIANKANYMGSDTNEVYIIKATKEGVVEEVVKESSKKEIASKILESTLLLVQEKIVTE